MDGMIRKGVVRPEVIEPDRLSNLAESRPPTGVDPFLLQSWGRPPVICGKLTSVLGLQLIISLSKTDCLLLTERFYCKLVLILLVFLGGLCSRHSFMQQVSFGHLLTMTCDEQHHDYRLEQGAPPRLGAASVS